MDDVVVEDLESEVETEALCDAASRARVGALVRQVLSKDCAYRTSFRDVFFDYNEGILTLRGRVPTFYLKQVVQTLLRNIDGVTCVDNQVDVVSATGLSSVRPK
jgi:hypothetical protein